MINLLTLQTVSFFNALRLEFLNADFIMPEKRDCFA